MIPQKIFIPRKTGFPIKLIKMKFKVVLVNFPFDNLSDFKLRPALCLTDSISEHNHILLAFITSNLNNATEITDLIINKSDVEFEKTGLKVSSVIKIHRLITTSDSILSLIHISEPTRQAEISYAVF